jgi:hypothetical protein
LIGFDSIHLIRLGSFFIISCLSAWQVAVRSTSGPRAAPSVCILPASFLPAAGGRAQRPHLHGFHCGAVDNINIWECQPIL